MVRDGVRETFERCATEYDKTIEKIVPYYHEQHEVMLSLIPFGRNDKIKALDLGIGTGILGHIILQNFSNSMVDGIDISEKMIEVCKETLKHFEGRFTLSCSDIEKTDFTSDYDLVVAGLAIHHLTDDAKRNFFRKIYKSLNVNGTFIIRDIIKSESNRMNELYHKLWCDFERKNGIDPEKISENARNNDIPASVENSMIWLREAGFRDVDCVWKYSNFAIIVGYK